MKTAPASARSAVPPVLAGRSPAMRDLADQVNALAARADTTGLLVGEAGVGKGSLAALIHERGARARKPFVTVAGLDPATEDTLLAADETGARRRAGRGTLFISEVGGLSAAAQRALAEWLADPQWESTGPRILASTSRDLVAAVTDAAFSEELYYRLTVMPIHVPPLRARTPEDLAALLAVLAQDLASEIPDAPAELSPPVIERLARHAWPGNLRQMRNVLERALIAARGAPVVEWDHLPGDVRDPLGAESDYVPRTIAEVERLQVERALRAHRHNRTRAAQALGISRATLIKKIREYGLGPRPRTAGT